MAGTRATSTSTTTITTSATTISRITLKQVRQVSGSIARNIAVMLPMVIERPRISLVGAPRVALVGQVVLVASVAREELGSLAVQVGSESRAVLVAQVELESPVVQAELVNPVAPVASARQVVRVELGNRAELAARRQSKPIVQVVGIRLVIRTWGIRAALRRVAAAVP